MNHEIKQVVEKMTNIIEYGDVSQQVKSLKVISKT